MKPNVGSTDRAIRVIAGLLLVLLAAVGYIGSWGWLGVVLIATGIIRFCPLYPLLGIRTCPAESAPPTFHENLPESFQNDPDQPQK